MTRATELVYGEYFLAVRAGVVSLSAATPACGLVLLFELCYKRAVIYAWVRATSRCGFLYSVRDARHARRPVLCKKHKVSTCNMHHKRSADTV